jgi:hypothetical protein
VERYWSGTTVAPSGVEDEDTAAGTTAGLGGTTARQEFQQQIKSMQGNGLTDTIAPLAGSTARGAVMATFAPHLYIGEVFFSNGLPRIFLSPPLKQELHLRRSLSLSLANQIPQDLVDWERGPRSTILSK